MRLRGHAHFVELAGRRPPFPWWAVAVLAALVALAAVVGK